MVKFVLHFVLSPSIVLCMVVRLITDTVNGRVTFLLDHFTTAVVTMYSWKFLSDEIFNDYLLLNFLQTNFQGTR